MATYSITTTPQTVASASTSRQLFVNNGQADIVLNLGGGRIEVLNPGGPGGVGASAVFVATASVSASTRADTSSLDVSTLPADSGLAGSGTVALDDLDPSVTGAYTPIPTGTPTVGQVPVVTDDSPLTLGWGAGGGGSSSIESCIEVDPSGYPTRPTAPMVVWRGWTDPTALPSFVTNVDLWAAADSPVAPQDQWFTDFSTDTAGLAPVGWTSRWSAPNSNLIVDESGNKILRINHAGSQYFLSWDTIPTTSADVEIVAKYRFSTTLVTATARVLQPVAVRAAGGIGTETGYVGRITNDPTAPKVGAARLAKPAADTYVPPSGPVSMPAYTDLGWNWIRLRASGSTISARSWPDGGTEPGTWTVTATNADVSAAGWVGVSAYIFTTVDIDKVGVGIGGATAPMVP